MNCIFCKIVAGEAEASKIYENDEILAFLDIQPVREGQILIIPKQHIDHFTDIPNDLANKIFTQGHRLAKIIKEKLQPERVGYVIHGYGVPHAHLILVPQQDPGDITSARYARQAENGQIIFSSKSIPILSRTELDQMAQKIKEK